MAADGHTLVFRRIIYAPLPLAFGTLMMAEYPATTRGRAHNETIQDLAASHYLFLSARLCIQTLPCLLGATITSSPCTRICIAILGPINVERVEFQVFVRSDPNGLRARSAAPVSNPEPAKVHGSSFEKPRFAQFRRRFGRAGFESGATEQAQAWPAT